MSHTNLFRPVVVEDANGQIAARAFSSRVASAQASTSGALVNFTEGVNTSAPNGTVPVVSLLATNAVANVDAVFSPKGNGALLAQIPDNATTGGNKRGVKSVDCQTDRSVNTQVASGSRSAIGGGLRNTASGVGATIPGGTNNLASGDDAFSSGNGNTASNTGSVAIGTSNTASAIGSTALGGSNTASGQYAFTHGTSNVADALYSDAGGNQAKVRGIIGAAVYGSGQLAVSGDAQRGDYVLRQRTTSATTAQLTTDAAAASTNNQVCVPVDGAFKFRGECVATQQSTGDTASWTVIGLAKNVGGTFSFVGTPSNTKDFSNAGASAWTLVITADTTNKAPRFDATGETAKNISWVLEIRTAETRGA